MKHNTVLEENDLFLFRVGVWHPGVHRPGGDTAAGLRETCGLVGNGNHPLRVPGRLRAFLRGHDRGAVWPGDLR